MRFFDFVNERHNIYRRRHRGLRWPWTTDPILQEYKFTNVFRELDKTTIYIRKHVRTIDEYAPPHSTVFALIAARWFNRIETLNILRIYGISSPWGLLDYAHWNPSQAVDVLRRCLPQGPWVSGAYMIKSPTGMDKLEGIVRNIDDAHAVVHDMVDHWGRDTTLRQATRDIMKLPFQGPFTAYEVVSDLRHTQVLNEAPDILTWANPGPGARRGLNRILGRHFNAPLSEERAVAEMRNLMGEWRSGEGPRNGSVWAEMRDVEHSLCEFDKYERIRLNEGRVKCKYTYRPTTE